MKALHWDGTQLRLNPDTPDPEPESDHALVRVRLAGVCSTDLQIFKGYMGFEGIPGHEMVGEVEDGPAEWIGKRVVAEINFACNACPACDRGMQRHCPTRSVMGILNADGAFAEKIAVPVANLHAVPDGLSDETAVFAEPLAAAFSIGEQVDLEPGAEVVVLGDGKLGLLCAFAQHASGAKVTLVGKHDEKLAKAAAAGIRSVHLDAFKAFQADMVVEATGSESGLALAMQTVRPRGTLVLKSTVAAEHTLSLAPLVINEISVVGSRCGLFPPALQALSEDQIDVSALISQVYALDEGLQAVEHAARAGVLKVLLKA